MPDVPTAPAVPAPACADCGAVEDGGAAGSVGAGAVVEGGAVAGAVVLGEVVLGEVVLGDAVLGDVEPLVPVAPGVLEDPALPIVGFARTNDGDAVAAPAAEADCSPACTQPVTVTVWAGCLPAADAPS